MRWRGRRQSSNVEDRRGSGGFGTGLGKGGIPLPPIGRGSGGPRLGGRGLLLLVVFVGVLWALGVSPLELLRSTVDPGAPSGQGSPSVARAPTGADDELSQFVRVVLADTEDVWHQLFSTSGQDYDEPTLVLFTDRVQSACGLSSAATGPFYCPSDHKLYIDLGFYRELVERFHAPGDFAQAYVIAHEVGHHVQNLVGILPAYHERRQSMSEEEANRMSVRVELQADCFAGVFAHYEHQKGYLEPGDLQEALSAAAAVGDDAIQRRAQGYVVPDSFTHGTSALRQKWFSVGFESGDVSRCNTFASGEL